MPFTEKQIAQIAAQSARLPLDPVVDGHIVCVRSMLYGQRRMLELLSKAATLDQPADKDKADHTAAGGEEHETTQGISASVESVPAAEPPRKRRRR
jgi:hypothetical protein